VGHVFLEEGAERGARAVTGTKQWAREGCQGVRSLRESTARNDGVDVRVDGRCRPQGLQDARANQGGSVPIKRSSAARRLRAVADACHMAWDAGR